LFIAWQAQLQLAGSRPEDGWVLYLAAAILFVVAVRSREPFSSAASGHLAEPTPPNTLPRSRTFGLLIGSSIVLGIAALNAFPIVAYQGLAWLLHGASITLFLSAFLQRPSSNLQPSTFNLQLLITHYFLLLLLLFAFIVRLWQNDVMPPGLWHDEARVGNVARRVLQDPTYRPIFEAYIERPLQDTFTAALAFVLFGDTIASLRLVPALFGIGNVWLAYLLFSRWLGRPAGLMAAALWAVMRYDLTFSRIKFDAISTPFFIMLTFYFLDKGLERKRIADFAFAGFTLGFGLTYYLPMRIFTLLLIALGVMLIALAFWSARSNAWRMYLRPWIPQVLFFSLGGLVALAPVAEFAILEPDIFWDRYRSASIFYDVEPVEAVNALWQSTLQHLAMFNYQGDQNGRHNLPGAPMLDPFMGMLGVLGFSLALRRWRELPNLWMLMLFAALLQGGIWSVNAEAPQGIRSIGVMPALVYFVTLALVAIHRTYSAHITHVSCFTHASRVFRFTPTITFTLLFLFVAYHNLDLYFNYQMKDPQVRYMHSYAETVIAREMNERATTHDFAVAWRYWSIPTITFLAPTVTFAPWMTLYDLPLASNPVRPVIVFIDLPQVTAFERIQSRYPSAQLEPITANDGQRLAYRVVLSAEMLRAGATR
jgi:hypothetical protein